MASSEKTQIRITGNRRPPEETDNPGCHLYGSLGLVALMGREGVDEIRPKNPVIDNIREALAESLQGKSFRPDVVAWNVSEYQYLGYCMVLRATKQGRWPISRLFEKADPHIATASSDTLYRPLYPFANSTPLSLSDLVTTARSWGYRAIHEVSLEGLLGQEQRMRHSDAVAYSLVSQCYIIQPDNALKRDTTWIREVSARLGGEPQWDVVSKDVQPDWMRIAPFSFRPADPVE